MKCINCGRTCEHYLCDACATVEVLDKLILQLYYYQPDKCENPHLSEFVSSLPEDCAPGSVIPAILEQLDPAITEYAYCLYYKFSKDERYEAATIAYLQTHDFLERYSQNLLYGLIHSYIPKEFIKPQQWCEKIAETEGLFCELYAIAAKYFAMIGEYGLADSLTEHALELCNNAHAGTFLFSSPEMMRVSLTTQKEDTNRYRTKKPYWPRNENAQKEIANFYNERGISYSPSSGTRKSNKIKESDFAPAVEYTGGNLSDYCAFWCAEAFSLSSHKGIYQIAAVKVRNGVITEEFQEFVRPWDNVLSRKTAAKEAGVDISVIEHADAVAVVMPKFFAFVGDDVLISTDALGNQFKLLSRAARYAGMSEIKNAICDLLDVAADVSPDLDGVNNTREYLLAHFAIAEGKNALEKAKASKELYECLKGINA